MERMEDHLLKIEIMLSDNCLPPGLVPAVPLQSQMIAQLQSRLELLENVLLGRFSPKAVIVSSQSKSSHPNVCTHRQET